MSLTCLGQCDSQGEYCGPSTASEVFFNFTTQLYACLCNDNAIVFIYLDKRKVLQQEYSQPIILPSPHLR